MQISLWPVGSPTRQEIGDRGRGALVGHVIHLDAGEELEERRAQVLRAAVAG